MAKFLMGNILMSMDVLTVSSAGARFADLGFRNAKENKPKVAKSYFLKSMMCLNIAQKKFEETDSKNGIESIEKMKKLVKKSILKCNDIEGASKKLWEINELLEK